jgi:hypothetical protein
MVKTGQLAGRGTTGLRLLAFSQPRSAIALPCSPANLLGDAWPEGGGNLLCTLHDHLGADAKKTQIIKKRPAVITNRNASSIIAMKPFYAKTPSG